MNAGSDLITNYRFELVEDHHHHGSGRYGVRIVLPVDISPAFPFLNTLLEDSQYDHGNGILIGVNNQQRYAFRPHEIQAGVVSEPSEAPPIIEKAIELVNRAWREQQDITPSFRERKLPAIYEIYKLLPGTNCKECGYLTCLACAADIRNGIISPDKCSLLSRPEYRTNKEQIHSLFPT